MFDWDFVNGLFNVEAVTVGERVYVIEHLRFFSCVNTKLTEVNIARLAEITNICVTQMAKKNMLIASLNF